MQRNISVTISLSQKYDKITYFICNPQTKFIAYEKSRLFFTERQPCITVRS